MDRFYIIRSEFGDEYRLRLTSEDSGMLSSDVRQRLMADGIEVVDVELERTKGLNVTSHAVLSKIEDCIAEFFLNHKNVMICFYCDFISLIPSMRRDMSVQEYRSRLFSNMFNRYVQVHRVDGVRNQVVTIEGVVETYFVHVITRTEHIGFAKLIGDGIQKDYGK